MLVRVAGDVSSSQAPAGGSAAGRVVAALVHAQVVLAAEGHGAQAAGERPLARVAALVPLQVAGAAEALRAEAARVRQVRRGGPHPTAATGGLQRPRGGHGSSTQRRLAGFILNAHVFLRALNEETRLSAQNALCVTLWPHTKI